MPLVGDSSFMLLDEPGHLDGRRAILPAFHDKVVKKNIGLVADVVRREVVSWPRDAPVALHPRLRALTLEVILRKLFSIEPSSDKRFNTLRDGIIAMLSVTASLVFPEPALRHGPGRQIWKRFLCQRAEVDELLYALIDERRLITGAQSDVLARLLAVPNSKSSTMSRRQIRDNVMSIILAGHETTASQLAWAFQLLAYNPAVLDRLTEEIDRGESDAYLMATIQEVLRHRSVFLFTIPRAVARPVEIGGWSYRPPAHLLGCIYLLHHDPRFYADPQQFRPERFLEAPPQPSVWLPWGGGRKRCVGLHLAMLEMKTVLQTVLTDMTVLPAARRMERPLWRSVIVTPHAGCRVVLRTREGSKAPIRGAGNTW